MKANESVVTAAALEPGTYKDFTGYINFDGIEGYAEHADFTLLGGYEKYMHGLVRMIWTDGTWLGGRCSLAQWKGGVWLGGAWHGGTWENGTWLGGEWRNGIRSLAVESGLRRDDGEA